MGLGKSIETLTLIMSEYETKTPPVYPTLIVCPLSAVDNWANEIEIFLGKTCPYMITRNDSIGKDGMDALDLDEMKKYKIIITNYETIRGIAKKYNLYEDLFECDNFGRKIGINFPAPLTEEEMTYTGKIMLFNTPYNRLVCFVSGTFIVTDEEV